jgi:hypothetical protein
MTWHLILFIRIVDRIGKGIRGAPRDALIVASTPPNRRGAAFGLHRAADTAGAVVSEASACIVVAVFFRELASVTLWLRLCVALRSHGVTHARIASVTFVFMNVFKSCLQPLTICAVSHN